MRKITLAALAAFLLAACSHYKFWDISEFHMDPNALADEEEIKLLYSSRGPDGNLDHEYFIHVIAVSQKTGDTVNIFTTADNGFVPGDGERVFNFISPESQMGRIASADLEDLEKVQHVSELEALRKPDLRSITRVARDPDFDDIARNTYPSIIGWIGTVGTAE